MKYTVLVNQQVMAKISPKLDFNDAALLDFCIDICKSTNKKIERLQNNNKQYTWLNYGYVIKQMPMLQLTTKSSILRRMEKLIEANYIEKYNQGTRVFIRLTEKVDELAFDDKKLTQYNKTDPVENEDEFADELPIVGIDYEESLTFVDKPVEKNKPLQE